MVKKEQKVFMKNLAAMTCIARNIKVNKGCNE